MNLTPVDSILALYVDFKNNKKPHESHINKIDSYLHTIPDYENNIEGNINSICLELLGAFLHIDVRLDDWSEFTMYLKNVFTRRIDI